MLSRSARTFTIALAFTLLIYFISSISKVKSSELRLMTRSLLLPVRSPLRLPLRSSSHAAISDSLSMYENELLSIFTSRSSIFISESESPSDSVSSDSFMISQFALPSSRTRVFILAASINIDLTS